MSSTPARAPVLFLLFNRPDLFERVLAPLEGLEPRPVFAAIDGPRPGVPGEAERCEQVRVIAESIPWANEVRLKAEASNLGCGPAVSDAITWALSEAPEVIVIEEDCVVHPSFLRFCDELLERYRDDERVMQVAGTNWGADPSRYAGGSYAFTSFAPIWGWATWRRAWELYDYRLDSWPRVKSSGLAHGMAVSPRFRRLLQRDWDRVRDGQGTWDHQWQYTLLRHHGFSVSPAVNLVANIGHARDDATQLREFDQVFGALSAGEMEFPLRHPPEVARDPRVEQVFERIYSQKLGWPGRLYRALTTRRIRSVIKRFVPRPM